MTAPAGSEPLGGGGINIADLSRRLSALEDVHAIEMLKWRYLRACDRKQPEAVRACFTADAVIDFEGFATFNDADSFVALFAEIGCQPHIVDMHHGQNPIVELTSPTHARGWFDLRFFQMDLRERRHTELAVSYDDEFVRHGDRWLIARTTSRRLAVLVRSIDADGAARIVEEAGMS